MAHKSLHIPADASLDVDGHRVDSYRLIETLTPDRTFLCSDASANVVVLVRLEDDCLHRRLLHPSIRDRLSRVRELPHPHIATLRGVERWDGFACLIWIYLDGETWDQYLNQNPQRFFQLASTLTAAVGTLHDLGIVHGNLHGRNIIVRPDGQPWLTHVSPYLYTDPNADITAVIGLLRDGARNLGADAQAQLDGLLDQRPSLKELSRLLTGTESPESEKESPELTRKIPSYRRRSLLGALLITVAAILLGTLLRSISTRQSLPGPATFPSLKPLGRS